MINHGIRPVLPPAKVDINLLLNPQEEDDRPHSPPPAQHHGGFGWRAKLQDYCNLHNIERPQYRHLSDTEGGKTVWKCVTVIDGQEISGRYWYDEKYIDIAEEDAAEVALGIPQTRNDPRLVKSVLSQSIEFTRDLTSSLRYYQQEEPTEAAQYEVDMPLSYPVDNKPHHSKTDRAPGREIENAFAKGRRLLPPLRSNELDSAITGDMLKYHDTNFMHRSAGDRKDNPVDPPSQHGDLDFSRGNKNVPEAFGYNWMENRLQDREEMNPIDSQMLLSLTSGQKEPSRSGNFRCEDCGLEFYHYNKYYSHKCSNSVKYQCKLCPEFFNKETYFKLHMEKHAREPGRIQRDFAVSPLTTPRAHFSGDLEGRTKEFDAGDVVMWRSSTVDTSDHFNGHQPESEQTQSVEPREYIAEPGEDRIEYSPIRYLCALCPPERRMPFSIRASFKRHVQYTHFPQQTYHRLIPQRGAGRRRDILHQHIRSKPNVSGKPTHVEINSATALLPPPRHCGVCSTPVDSWDEFFDCVCEHSISPEAEVGRGQEREDDVDVDAGFEYQRPELANSLEVGDHVQVEMGKTSENDPGAVGALQTLLNDAATSRNGAFTDSGYGSYACGKSTIDIAMDGCMPRNGEGKATECIDDGQSIYSEVTVADSTKKGYVSVLAEVLCEAISFCQPSEDILERVYDVLPSLLKVFALSVGNESTNQIYRDVMVFIHKYRRDIIASCKERISDAEPTYEGQDDSNEMSLADKMQLWEMNQDDIEGSPPTPLEDDYFDDDMSEIEADDAPEIEPNLPGIQSYKELIQSSPAYTKLISNLRRECLLVSADPNAMENIHNAIIQMLPISPKVSRTHQTEAFHTTITVDWDPLLFLQEQEYPEPPDVAIGKVITLTGSATTAQATTCADYLDQTWPSIGDCMLELIQNVLKSNWGGISLVMLPDNTQVSAWMDLAEDEFKCPLVVVVDGIASSIAEVGEVLAWLGSALRSSPYEHGVAFTRPFVDYGLHLPHRLDHSCTIRFETSRDNIPASVNGQCWHDLFRNPVVAEGYPIPRRTHSRPGIDISLQIMAALAETSCVNPFDGRPFIKGFSTLLFPTEYSENTVIWHLLFNNNGDRISYLDGMKFATVNVNIPLAGLQNVRHVLGWCSEMKFFAGAHGASYDIKNSRLPRASGDSPFSNTSISMGQIITDDLTFNIGRKDIPVHLSRNGYVSKLKWISKKFVLLWDEGDKRGWLINGTSALLHLVRTSLELDRMNEFACVSQFDPTKLKGANIYQPGSATRILLNESNLKLGIYPEGDGFIPFQDQVTRFYDLMEKMIDHQFGVMNSISINDVSRSHLEGWDFHDLASERDPVWPRVASLDSTGMSWMDLVRSIHAVTLFGRGFGDMIQPVNSCSQWSRLPTGQSYLAVSHADLQEIMQAGHGDPYSTPVRLTDNIIWHIPEQSSEHCRCSRDSKHSNIVQVLLPSSMESQLTEKSFTYNENTNGAFVFGYNSVHQWYWNELGDPSMDPIEAGSALVSKASSIPLSHDSGIGKSLGSLTSKDRESSTESSFNPSASERYFESPRDTLRSISRNNSYQYSLRTSARIYYVGIVCALHRELKAVRMLLDSEHIDDGVPKVDPNSYVFGRMSGHNIVATCLPDGEYGTSPAAYVASNMKRSFPDIKFCLMVGIGGGVPSANNDIRLGDVVVSKPIGSGVGVLPYDMQKTLEGGMVEMNGYLHPPPRHLRSTLSEMQSDPRLSKNALQTYLQKIGECDKTYSHPGPDTDILYTAGYSHCPSKGTCCDCDVSRVVYRHPRSSDQPIIHYGTIASGNQVMKDAITRDKWGKDYDVLCFEMEAAGLMNIFPSLIIRGICDYCDSHKNKKWQNYAAATAAAFTKLLLSRVRTESEVDQQSGGLDSMFKGRKRSLGESTVENVAKQQRIYKPLSRAES